MTSLSLGNYEQVNQVSQSLDQFLHFVDSETKTLKSIYNLTNLINSKNIKNDEIFDILYSIQSSVERIETCIDDFDSSLDTELQQLQQTKQLYEIAKEQEEYLNTIQIILNENKENNQLLQTTISLFDFDKVSKITRGRITIKQLNKSYQLLQKLSQEKQKILSMSKKQMTKAAIIALEVSL